MSFNVAEFEARLESARKRMSGTCRCWECRHPKAAGFLLGLACAVIVGLLWHAARPA